MGYTYHGVELVNCSPPRRKGPFTHFPHGQYKDRRVEDIIRINPQYVMWAVKEWLNLTPSQAGLFEAVTGGGIIPDRYIVEEVPKPISPKDRQESPPKEDSQVPHISMGWFSWSPDGVDMVEDAGDTVPNYEFDPLLTPDWWPRFKKECEGKSGSQRRDIFERYRREEIQEMMKFWHKEYAEYRKNHPQE